jgi:transcription elongation factor/antiterminator RfaH
MTKGSVPPSADSVGDNSDSVHWYVVQTAPRKEFTAQFHLRNQNFETFCPAIHKTVRHARQLRNVRAPLFPRYIFVQMDLGKQRWRSVNGTIGVISIITSGDHPTPVPQGLVEDLIAATDSTNGVRLDRGLAIGDSVEIKQGPFAGFMAKLIRLDAGGRVRLLLETMGNSMPVVINAASLRKVST